MSWPPMLWCFLMLRQSGRRRQERGSRQGFVDLEPGDLPEEIQGRYVLGVPHSYSSLCQIYLIQIIVLPCVWPTGACCVPHLYSLLCQVQDSSLKIHDQQCLVLAVLQCMLLIFMYVENDAPWKLSLRYKAFLMCCKDSLCVTRNLSLVLAMHV